jgi:hypothetical protein
MSLDPVTAALDIGGKLIDRLWPNPEQRDAAKLKMLELQQNGELAAMMAEVDLAKGQLDVNKVEAANSNLFVSGWRPAVGWVCVGGLAYEFLVLPLLPGLVGMFTSTPSLVAIPMGDLMTLLFGMLGIGGMRTYEKLKGIAK